MIGLLQLSHLFNTLLLPAFWAVSLSSFLHLPEYLLWVFVYPKVATRALVFTNASFLLLLSVDFRFKHLLASQCALLWSTLGKLIWFPRISALFFYKMQAFCYSFFPPVCLIPYFHFFVLLPFHGSSVTVTGVNGPCLCLSSPNLTFDYLAGSLWLNPSLASLFILRWTGLLVDLPYSH